MNEPNKTQNKRRRWGQIATVVFNNPNERPLFVNKGDQIRWVAEDKRYSVIKKDRTVYLIPESAVVYVRLEPQSEETVAEEGQENAEQPS